LSPSEHSGGLNKKENQHKERPMLVFVYLNHYKGEK